MTNENGKTKCILIVKSMDDPKLRYITAKKLFELWPETPFMEWKGKLDALETVVLMRAESSLELDNHKRALADLGADVEIVQQQSIGGKAIF